jgi:uncharacterized protein YbcI
MTQVEERPDRRNGSVAAAISNATVRIVREYTGRGPTEARAVMSDDLVSVLMVDTLTKAEKSLVENGEAELVLTIRRQFQRTMREELIGAVEGLSGRKVVAFMSDNHIDPDMAVESFVLAPAAGVAEQ